MSAELPSTEQIFTETSRVVPLYQLHLDSEGGKRHGPENSDGRILEKMKEIAQ